MAGDRWTFLVMRGEDDPVQQYTLSAKSLRALAGAGVLASALVVAGGLVLGAYSTQRANARTLTSTSGSMLTVVVQRPLLRFRAEDALRNAWNRLQR